MMKGMKGESDAGPLQRRKVSITSAEMRSSHAILNIKIWSALDNKSDNHPDYLSPTGSRSDLYQAREMMAE